MFFLKKGIPKEQEVVLCTVRNILPHSVFADIDEYENLKGMIHISEIAPGRIRNIRDYVREGKKVVCMVLKVDSMKGQIDLSLRRVGSASRKIKEEEIKQEAKAEKIMGYVGQKLGVKPKILLEEVVGKILKQYKTVFECLKDVAARGAVVLQSIGVDEKYVKVLAEIVQEKMKPPEYIVEKEVRVRCNAKAGVHAIKGMFAEGKEFAKANNIDANFIYISAPKYRVEIRSKDYKSAEHDMQKVIAVLEGRIKKEGGILEANE